jgi:hypothetical protein
MELIKTPKESHKLGDDGLPKDNNIRNLASTYSRLKGTLACVMHA